MKTILTILLIGTTLATTGCNLLFKVPFGGPKLVPTETFFVDEASPVGSAITAAILTLAPSNATLNLAGGAQGLGDGTIQYNVAKWKPNLVVEGSNLHIEQEVPKASVAATPKDSLNQWDLKLGNTLANISISCPSGDYNLNFANTLPDGATISVNSGVGNLRLVFPAGATVKVDVTRGPAKISTEGGWTASDGTYSSGDSGPVWMVQVDIGVGNLTLVAE